MLLKQTLLQPSQLIIHIDDQKQYLTGGRNVAVVDKLKTNYRLRPSPKDQKERKQEFAGVTFKLAFTAFIICCNLLRITV